MTPSQGSKSQDPKSDNQEKVKPWILKPVAPERLDGLPRGVIFDWDNTLVSSWGAITSALNAALDVAGQPHWTEQDLEVALSGTSEGMSGAKDVLVNIFGEHWEQAKATFYETYKPHPHPRLGACDLLDDLKQVGAQMVVVTTRLAHQVRQEAEDVGLSGYFTDILGAENSPRVKPHIHAAEVAVKHLGAASELKPDACIWVVGDTDIDLMFAHNARLHHRGCVPILIRSTPLSKRALQACPPALVCKDCGELRRALQTLS